MKTRDVSTAKVFISQGDSLLGWRRPSRSKCSEFSPTSCFVFALLIDFCNTYTRYVNMYSMHCTVPIEHSSMLPCMCMGSHYHSFQPCTHNSYKQYKTHSTEGDTHQLSRILLLEEPWFKIQNQVLTSKLPFQPEPWHTLPSQRTTVLLHWRTGEAALTRRAFTTMVPRCSLLSCQRRPAPETSVAGCPLQLGDPCGRRRTK